MVRCLAQVMQRRRGLPGSPLEAQATKYHECLAKLYRGENPAADVLPPPEFGTIKAVKASIWPWLEPFFR